MSRPIQLIVAEGFLDRVAAQQIAVSLEIEVEGPIQDTGGIDRFWETITKYNDAAKACGVVLALADHDEGACVGPKLNRKLPARHKNLVLRLCVRELESWLLADAKALSEYLSVSLGRFPDAPDDETNPKQTLVNLARNSKKQAIIGGMVPKHTHPGLVGQEYTKIMEEFIREHWKPLRAAKNSPSLKRALKAIRLACS